MLSECEKAVLRSLAFRASQETDKAVKKSKENQLSPGSNKSWALGPKELLVAALLILKIVRRRIGDLS